MLGEKVVDGRQYLIGQFVLFQPMAESQDGALVGQASMCIELRKLPLQRGVKEGLFHRRVG